MADSQRHVVAILVEVTGRNDEERFADGERKSPPDALFMTSPLACPSEAIDNPDFDVHVIAGQTGYLQRGSSAGATVDQADSRTGSHQWHE